MGQDISSPRDPTLSAARAGSLGSDPKRLQRRQRSLSQGDLGSGYPIPGQSPPATGPGPQPPPTGFESQSQTETQTQSQSQVLSQAGQIAERSIGVIGQGPFSAPLPTGSPPPYTPRDTINTGVGTSQVGYGYSNRNIIDAKHHFVEEPESIQATNEGATGVRRNVSARPAPSVPTTTTHRRTMSHGAYSSTSPNTHTYVSPNVRNRANQSNQGNPSHQESLSSNSSHDNSSIGHGSFQTPGHAASVSANRKQAPLPPPPTDSGTSNSNSNTASRSNTRRDRTGTVDRSSSTSRSAHGHTRPNSQTGSQTSPPRQPTRRNSYENPLLQLLKYDTVIIVDDSTSMEGPLWFEAREALAGVASLAGKYDADGVDIVFLNSPLEGRGLRHGRDVKRLFDQVQPSGITPIGEKLELMLLNYLSGLEHAKEMAENGDNSLLKQIKPVNFLVLTDGAPSDDPESVIVASARRLDAGNYPISQVGIQFVQIGNDPDAADFLRELDDGLAGKYGIRDIVDTTPYSGTQLDTAVLAKILLGGINRRVDRRGTVL